MSHADFERAASQAVVNSILVSKPGHDELLASFESMKDVLFDAQSKMSKMQWKRVYRVKDCAELFKYKEIKSCPNVSRRLLYMFFNPKLIELARAIVDATSVNAVDDLISVHLSIRDRRPS